MCKLKTVTSLQSTTPLWIMTSKKLLQGVSHSANLPPPIYTSISQDHLQLGEEATGLMAAIPESYSLPLFYLLKSVKGSTTISIGRAITGVFCSIGSHGYQATVISD